MIFVQMNYTESLVFKISKYNNTKYNIFEQIKRLKLKEATKKHLNIILFLF